MSFPSKETIVDACNIPAASEYGKNKAKVILCFHVIAGTIISFALFECVCVCDHKIHVYVH
jgi:hypothetical protein